jgi:hypothetical protein
MNSRFFFLIVVAWLGGIMLVSLLYGTSGIRESMQATMAVVAPLHFLQKQQIGSQAVQTESQIHH